MASLSHRFDASYLSWEKSWRDKLSWEPGIRAEGRAEGKAEGLTEGISIGIDQGKIEGKMEGQRELLDRLVAAGVIAQSSIEHALLLLNVNQPNGSANG